MTDETKSSGRAARLGRHLRRNLVAYVALGIAVSMSPLPAYAASVAVGTSGIQNGAVTTPKLANAAVKAHKLGANSVNSSKIQDGKILKNDLAASARGYTRIHTERVEVADVPNTADTTRDVFCPAGEVAIGGGSYAVPNSGIIVLGGSNGNVETSIPVFDGQFFNGPVGDNVAPEGWRTVINHNESNNTSVFFYAICAAK